MVNNTKHIISIRDFVYDSMMEHFRRIDEIKKSFSTLKNGFRYVLRKEDVPLRFACICDEANQRTLMTIHGAIEALGGAYANYSPRFSTHAAGQSYDTTATNVRNNGFAGIFIRDDGDNDAAEKMKEAIDFYGYDIPVINAGSGEKGEQLIQTLTTIYTIYELFPQRFLDGDLSLVFINDLSRSRTIHYILVGLRRLELPFRIFLVGPENECIPEKIWLEINDAKTRLDIKKATNLHDVTPLGDFFYSTGLHEEEPPEVGDLPCNQKKENRKCLRIWRESET